MSRFLSLFGFLLVVAVLLVPCVALAQVETLSSRPLEEELQLEIETWLSEQYDGSVAPDYLVYPPMFPGLSEYREPSLLEPEYLGHVAPNIAFVHARLGTGFLEFPDVDIIVAVQLDTWTPLAVMESPLFRASAPEFFTLFLDVPIATDDDRVAISMDVAQMMGVITVISRVGEPSWVNENELSIVIFHHDRPWRDVRFRFSEQGLAEIEMLVP